MANYVSFKTGTKAQYLALQTKDINTLYFCDDTKEFFKGTTNYTESIRVGKYGVKDSETFPENAAQGILYINLDTGNGKVWDGTAWTSVMTLRTTGLDYNADTDKNVIATVELLQEVIKDYTDKIDNIESTTIPNYIDSLNLATTYEAKGAAAAVLGTESDTSDNKTVYGAFAGINKVNETISEIKADVAVYDIESTSSETYAAVYRLKKIVGENSEFVGAPINVPKDMVVQSGSVKTVETADTPVTGYAVGDKYIDLVISNSSNDHIYIKVSDLIDVNTSTNNALTVDGQNLTVVVKSANGLSITDDGISMGLADGTANGAMSASHFTKLSQMINITTAGNGIDVTDGKISVKSADGTIIVGEDGVGVGEIAAAKVLGLKTVATTGEYSDLTGTPEVATPSVNGLMSSEDKTKLNTIAENAQVNILETVQVNGVALTNTSKVVNIKVETGSTDGTIAVNGIDVAVAGLGTAAYKNVDAFDAAGAAAAVLGTESDTSDKNTIYGVKAKIVEDLSNAKIEWGTF